MAFKGVDLYRIDDLLSDEERMVRDTVRRFVDERVLPIIDKHFEDGTFPRNSFVKWRSLVCSAAICRKSTVAPT
jgi:alkylation response protein AidB-like acyl-CoA dehydrogenase